MPTTAFKSPTAVRSMYVDGGSGGAEVNNEADILTGGYAIFTLPDGSSYSPTSDETSKGHVLPPTVLQHGYDFSSLPSGAVIIGIHLKSTVFSENTEEEDLVNGFFFQLSTFPNEVPFYDEEYLWFEPQEATANLNDPSLQVIGGSNNVFQANPNITIDGMFIYSLDGASHNYQVQTSTLDSFGYDFFYNGHEMIIQPLTLGYASSYMDAYGCISDNHYLNIVANGGTVTASFPGFFSDVIFVGQSGPVTPGDATFQCAVSDEATMNSLSDQLNNHPTTSSYLWSSFFTGVQFSLNAQDVGAYTDAIQLSTNVPAYISFPNGGFFQGGADPDQTVSTMLNFEAVAPFNASGGPLYARVVNGQAAVLQITNTFSHMSFKTKAPASIFKDPLFGISGFYNWNTYGGDLLNYPASPDNTIKMGITTIALDYFLPGGGLSTLGVG